MRRNPRGRNKKSNKSIKIDYKKTHKSLIYIIIFLFIVFISVSIFYTLKNNNKTNEFLETSNSNIENENNDEETNKKEEETDTTFTMAAIGDVMCHNTQYMDAYNKDTGEYDFSYVFENINYYTKIADITVGSLETSFAGEERGYSNYLVFQEPLMF